MSTQDDDDLDLLLSLEERVLETPPGSPSNRPSNSPGCLSDDGSPKRRGTGDMSAFRNIVQDCLDYEPRCVEKVGKPKKSDDAVTEKFSGLRMRNQVMTPAELKNHFSDIRFVRLSTIKNILVGETLSGCWATVGVLTEKGNPRTSSTGKSYSIWKFGCLNEETVSVFLFGDAYQKNLMEKAGTVFALFNCNVRKDAMGTGFSLSVYSAGQILKMGTSVDYGVCKGKRKDGMACAVVINIRHGIYCKYHNSKTSEKYYVTRTELKGGNLRTAFRNPPQSEGIYMVDPLAAKTSAKKQMEPVKLLSVEGLRKALSNAGKVTTKIHSQGIRFLSEVAVNKPSRNAIKESVQHKLKTDLEKRKSPINKVNPSATTKNRQPESKRKKAEHGDAMAYKTVQNKGNFVELDLVSSDEEI